MYLVYYECPECGTKWQSADEELNYSECPDCGQGRVNVHHSLDVPDWDESLEIYLKEVKERESGNQP